MKKKIKKATARIITILFILTVSWLAVNQLFVKPIKSVFAENPVTFVNVLITALVYLLLIGAVYLIAKLVKWAMDHAA